MHGVKNVLGHFTSGGKKGLVHPYYPEVRMRDGGGGGSDGGGGAAAAAATPGVSGTQSPADWIPTSTEWRSSSKEVWTL